MMENTPFSVAISVYKNDNPAHFDRALQSITDEQTVQPAEIVLVVDGPVPDGLEAVIDKYAAALKVVRLPQNGGLGNALRVALENCSHELVARMDSDDVAVPTRFEQQLAFFAANEAVDIVGGDISEFVGEEQNIVAHRRVPATDREIKEYLKTRCPFNHVSVMYKKSAVDAAGGYLDLFWNEDYYLWIRMAEQGAVMANTGTVLVNVRTGADMYRRRGGKAYYRSEKFLQEYMRQRGMITQGVYLSNLLKRFIVQRLLPNSLRGVVFKLFARS